METTLLQGLFKGCKRLKMEEKMEVYDLRFKVWGPKSLGFLRFRVDKI